MNKGYMIVGGCGRLGADIAGKLSEQGENVAVIDWNKQAFRKLPLSFGGLTIVAGITEIDKLEAANISKATAFLAVTDNDCINICAAQIAKKIFHVPKVVARIYDEEKKPLLESYGIESICPTKLSEKVFFEGM